MQRVIKEFENVYFFKDAFKSQLYGTPFLINTKGFNKEEVEEVKKFIKENGTEFYTTDDDDLDKTEGYYYGVGGIDFEPLDKMQADSGHTKLWYKEAPGIWKQL
jgi:hypothetical protein|tara:strand:+ start:474 stop:785 length:312 start_codon:yes stop_codon:yes gene_type:complete